MKTVTPSNAITGYKVVYQGSAARKPITKYFKTRYSFTIPISDNTFYQVKIYPYLVLGNKRYVSSTSTNRYVADSFKKVKTTSSNSFTLTGMKKNTKYGIKVIANKKVKNKVWRSDSKIYNMSLS